MWLEADLLGEGASLLAHDSALPVEQFEWLTVSREVKPDAKMGSCRSSPSTRLSVQETDPAVAVDRDLVVCLAPIFIVVAKKENAIAFAANHSHERYVRGLDTDETARLLATGAGPLGSCCDYLFDTVSHLEALGIRDKRMEALVERVRACQASATPPELSD